VATYNRIHAVIEMRRCIAEVEWFVVPVHKFARVFLDHIAKADQSEVVSTLQDVFGCNVCMDKTTIVYALKVREYNAPWMKFASIWSLVDQVGCQIATPYLSSHSSR